MNGVGTTAQCRESWKTLCKPSAPIGRRDSTK